MLIGYGEDALTLLLLGGHVTAFVTALEGAVPERPPFVIFRPSLGRRATARASDGTPIEGLRALVGEFDAIVGTERGTYLVEAKWPHSGRMADDGVLRLSSTQVRRHKVMRHYLAAWRTLPTLSQDYPLPAHRWREFIGGTDIENELRALGVAVPNHSSTMARSLMRIMRILNECGPVTDVLLFCRTLSDVARGKVRARAVVPHTVDPGTFALIVADLRHDHFDGFIHLPLATTDAPHWVTFGRV